LEIGDTAGLETCATGEASSVENVEEPQMKSSGTPGAPKSSLDEEATGLPVFKTWPAVYLFVFVTFVIWVLLLAALTGIFS
jgi:hypothetical protein